MSPPKASVSETGTIVLARHGEPALSRKVRLSALEYSNFWAKYEVGGLAPVQSPPPELVERVGRTHLLLSSTRRRALESVRTLAADKAFTSHDILIEAPLPTPAFPAFIRLSPKIWGFIVRFWWWFFNHHADQESRAQAEARADRVADMLEEIAGRGEDVVVVAHGFFNFMVARALRARGWRMTASKGFKYWSTRTFER